MVLFLAGLVALQRPVTAWGMLYQLAIYGGIAAAALVAVLSTPARPGPNLLCLASSALFFGYVIARSVASPVPYVARADLYAALAALTVYGAVMTAFASSAMRLALLVPLLALAAIHVTLGLVQAGVGENLSLLLPSLESVKAGERGSGWFVNPNHLAGFLEIIGVLGLSLTCWSRWPGWAKVLCGYFTAAAYLGLALTGSRGGYASAAFSIIVFALLSLFVLRAAGAWTLVKSGAVGLFIILGVFYGLWQLIESTPKLGARIQSVSLDQGRPGLWNAALEQWKLQPVTGTGSGTYRFYGRQFRAPEMQQDPVYAHNDYLQLLAEYGVIGAAGFLLFFAIHLYSGWRTFLNLGLRRAATGDPLPSTRLALTIGALSAVAAYVVHSAVDFNLHIPANALLLAAVFGILANPDLAGVHHVPAWRIRLPRYALAVVGAALLVQCLRLLPGEYYADKARRALWDEEHATAIALAEKALQHEQKNPNIFFYLGRARPALIAEDAPAEERVATYERAIADFETARRLAPLDGTYPLEIALMYDRLGRFAEAAEMYQVARAHDPRSRSVEQFYRFHRYSWLRSGQKDFVPEPGEFDKPERRRRRN